MENSKTLLELAPITNTFGIVLTLLSCSLSLRRHAHGTLGKHLMHMAHKNGNTSGVSKLSLDWIIQDFRETCLSRSLTFRLAKMAWRQNTLAKEECRRVYHCDNKRLSGSNKCWIFKSMWNIKILWHRICKICQSFTHQSVIVVTFPRPKTWRWTKRTVIGCLTCRSNGLMDGPWPMTATIDSEGLATRD